MLINDWQIVQICSHVAGGDDRCPFCPQSVHLSRKCPERSPKHNLPFVLSHCPEEPWSWQFLMDAVRRNTWEIYQWLISPCPSCLCLLDPCLAGRHRVSAGVTGAELNLIGQTGCPLPMVDGWLYWRLPVINFWLTYRICHKVMSSIVYRWPPIRGQLRPVVLPLLFVEYLFIVILYWAITILLFVQCSQWYYTRLKLVLYQYKHLTRPYSVSHTKYIIKLALYRLYWLWGPQLNVAWTIGWCIFQSK